jgi:hypothetical protein
LSLLLILCVNATRPPLHRGHTRRQLPEGHTRRQLPELHRQFSELHQLASRFQSMFMRPNKNSAELLTKFKAKTDDIVSRISATIES